MNYKKYLTQKNLAIAYIFLLVLGFIYIGTVLSTDTIDVSEEKEEKQVEDISEARMDLQINDGKTIKSYSERLTNDETVLNFIEYLRQTDQITYEKTAYVYGTELVMVNGVRSDENTIWNVYENDRKITLEMNEVELNGDNVYYLKLEPRN